MCSRSWASNCKFIFLLLPLEGTTPEHCTKAPKGKHYSNQILHVHFQLLVRFKSHPPPPTPPSEKALPPFPQCYWQALSLASWEVFSTGTHRNPGQLSSPCCGWPCPLHSPGSPDIKGGVASDLHTHDNNFFVSRSTLIEHSALHPPIFGRNCPSQEPPQKFTWTRLGNHETLKLGELSRLPHKQSLKPCRY